MERPLAALCAVGVILAFGGATYQFSEQKLWALFVTVVFCLAMNRFFFASRYRITPTDLCVHMPLLRTRNLRWDEVRRIDVGSMAAWVSPYRRRSWREPRRGIHVLFGRERERILQELRRLAPEAMPGKSSESRGA